MSVFGYGQSYAPVQTSVQTAPQLNLGQGPTQSWQSGNLGYNAMFGAPDRNPNPSFTNQSASKPYEWSVLGGSRGYWANPLEKIFGASSAPIKGQGTSSFAVNRVLDRNQGDPSLGFNPRTFGELEQGISGLGFEQLQNIDRNQSGVRSAFGALGQHYSNAFANQKYAGGKGKVAELAGSGVERKDWNQGTAQNFLQSAYNQILNRLNDSYLL